MINQYKGHLFLIVAGVITVAASLLIASTMILTRESLFPSALWLAGFTFLFFNVSYLFLLSIARPFIEEPIFSECHIEEFPKTALVYPIRNEDHGLYERMDYSLSGNRVPNLNLWILSDSDASYEPAELELVERLKSKYPNRVYYRRRVKPVERKQGNIKEFLTSHPEYQWLYIADADSMVPRGTVLKLLRKAVHPDNQDVAIFQCFIRIAHATSWYARLEKIGAEFGQKLYFTGLQSLFGRLISFGHHHLVRADLLASIRLPEGLLSHDNWDTVLLDQQGYRVVFCPDVFGYDEVPSNYLEARARAGRWAQGTLQGWPLIFKRNISLASRFMAFYGIYLYLGDIIFFLWVLLGLSAHSAWFGELIHFKIDTIWLGLFTNSVLKAVLTFSMGVTFFHKAVIVRSFDDLRKYLYELFISSLITLNNFFYVPLSIVTQPFKKLMWRPMKKDPFEKVGMSQAIKSLWPGTLFAAGLLYFCTHETPYFVWQALPIMGSLLLSIPLVYFTSKAMPEVLRKWI